MNFSLVSTYRQKIFVVTGEEDILAFMAYIPEASSDETLCLYYYAEDKYSVVDRERWENFGGLHFEIIADLRAIVPLPGWCDESTCIIYSGSPQGKEQLWAWLISKGFPESCLYVIQGSILAKG